MHSISISQMKLMLPICFKAYLYASTIYETVAHQVGIL